MIARALYLICGWLAIASICIFPPLAMVSRLVDKGILQ